MIYTYPDAPKGTYAIDLGFAEIEKVAKGKRVFDVVVDGSLTEYAYDPAAAVGRTPPTGVPPSWTQGRSTDRGAAGLAGTEGPEHRRAAGDARPARRPGGAAAGARAAGAGPGAGGTRRSLVLDEGDRRALPAGYAGVRVARRQCLRRAVVRLQLPFPVLRHGLGRCVRDDERHAGLRPRQLAVEQHGTAVAYPIDAIYPFWDDLFVDDEAGIYFGTTEVDGLPAEVIEWRNVTFYDDRTARVSFSVTLIADGRIQIGYGDGVGGDNPLTRGSSATVGVESLTRNPASQYSFNEAVLTAGLGLELHPPGVGHGRGHGPLTRTTASRSQARSSPSAGPVVSGSSRRTSGAGGRPRRWSARTPWRLGRRTTSRPAIR